jgi:hypothetical protein
MQNDDTTGCMIPFVNFLGFWNELTLKELQVRLNFFWKLFEWIGIVMKKPLSIQGHAYLLS